jgi:hypothetical protein
MSNDDQEVIFGGHGQGPRTLKIIADGVMVWVRTGLADEDGRRVTRVDFSPDNEERGGDGRGGIWDLAEDGHRIIRRGAPDDEQTWQPSTDPVEHRWTLVTSGPLDETTLEQIALHIEDGDVRGSYVHDENGKLTLVVMDQATEARGLEWGHALEHAPAILDDPTVEPWLREHDAWDNEGSDIYVLVVLYNEEMYPLINRPTLVVDVPRVQANRVRSALIELIAGDDNDED